MWGKDKKLYVAEPELLEMHEDIKKLWAGLASQSSHVAMMSQDLKTAPSSLLLERIEGLERRFSSLHALLTEKSPATGAERLSKTGKAFKTLYNR